MRYINNERDIVNKLMKREVKYLGCPMECEDKVVRFGGWKMRSWKEEEENGSYLRRVSHQQSHVCSEFERTLQDFEIQLIPYALFLLSPHCNSLNHVGNDQKASDSHASCLSSPCLFVNGLEGYHRRNWRSLHLSAFTT